MTLTFDDDILLAVLGDALTPEPVEPGAPELAALHRALEIRPADTDDDDGVQLAPVIPMFTPSPRSVMWSRIHRLRHPVAAAVAVGILATSGVAAAGVATDRLPGPTRNVAYALGLPVTSPRSNRPRAPWLSWRPPWPPTIPSRSGPRAPCCVPRWPDCRPPTWRRSRRRRPTC